MFLVYPCKELFWIRDLHRVQHYSFSQITVSITTTDSPYNFEEDNRKGFFGPEVLGKTSYWYIHILLNLTYPTNSGSSVAFLHRILLGLYVLNSNFNLRLNWTMQNKQINTPDWAKCEELHDVTLTRTKQSWTFKLCLVTWSYQHWSSSCLGRRVVDHHWRQCEDIISTIQERSVCWKGFNHVEGIKSYIAHIGQLAVAVAAD